MNQKDVTVEQCLASLCLSENRNTVMANLPLRARGKQTEGK